MDFIAAFSDCFNKKIANSAMPFNWYATELILEFAGVKCRIKSPALIFLISYQNGGYADWRNNDRANWHNVLDVIIHNMTAINTINTHQIIIEIHEQTNLNFMTVPNCIIKLAADVVLTEPIQCVLANISPHQKANNLSSSYLEYEAVYMEPTPLRKVSNYTDIKIVTGSYSLIAECNCNCDIIYLTGSHSCPLDPLQYHFEKTKKLCLLYKNNIYINTSHLLFDDLIGYIQNNDHIDTSTNMTTHSNCICYYNIKAPYALFINVDIHSPHLFKNAYK